MAAPKKAVGPKSDKIWRDAVMIAVKRQAEDGKPFLAKLADQLVLKAVDGDVAALKEIGDRLDGKPAQSIAMGQDPDRGPIKVSWEK